ncbi:phosphatidylserine decarboxylase [Sulfurimonas aquatica]|uniref:Phosphatidylserine decarboxylase n=1 Tax=Sulfurimonas aquatica TaxID=2672570 RepID=A0A975GDG9_9BACT|nr:phosphatidylserine decarboxylase [Sulfurimonas aquatica]QSZ42577.1 phosphatidylserine decarboxylase [Sulfurimonas aquatica]
MKSNLLPVAKEGWIYISYSLVAFILFSLLDLSFLSLVSLTIVLFLVYVYRNPERQLPMFANFSVVAPCDGVVSAIVELEDDREYSYRVDVESGYSDISILRAPMNSKVEAINLVNGTRVSKNSKLFSSINESCTVVFRDESNNRVKVMHRLSQSFAPISFDLKVSQQLHQTSRYGVILCGVTSIYLPSNFRLDVNISSEIKSSETLLGYFS